MKTLELILGEDNKPYIREQKPTIVLEFDSDDDLLKFLLENVEFGVSSEDKKKIAIDIRNVKDETQFLEKLNLKLDEMGLQKR